MVKYKWNISKEEGQTIVFSNLKDIFSNEKTNQIELNNLTVFRGKRKIYLMLKPKLL